MFFKKDTKMLFFLKKKIVFSPLRFLEFTKNDVARDIIAEKCYEKVERMLRFGRGEGMERNNLSNIDIAFVYIVLDEFRNCIFGYFFEIFS